MSCRDGLRPRPQQHQTGCPVDVVIRRGAACCHATAGAADVALAAVQTVECGREPLLGACVPGCREPGAARRRVVDEDGESVGVGVPDGERPRDIAAVAARDCREQREEVRRIAELSLRDPLYFVRRGALRSLELLGDTEAIPALQVAIERDVEGAVRYEARLAIDRLRRDTTREQELGAVRNDIDELRRANKDLRDRLARLEGAGKGRGRK